MLGLLKSDAKLVERMKDSARKPVTKQQLSKQRISFVYGNLPKDSAVTRAQVAERVKQNEGV